MPAWDELLNEFQSQPDEEKFAWLKAGLTAALGDVSRLRGDRQVVIYGSAFLQKQYAPGWAVMITHEDLNALMSVIYGMDWTKGLTLILHTPGGDPGAAEAIVDYLRSKFPHGLEVIVPTLAMSAGTMISLASDRVVLGRQSQLGPIDPQMGLPDGRRVSARAIVEQFDRAKAEVVADQTTAHIWAPIVQSLGPAVLQEAQNALAYAENMVANWLARYMLSGTRDPAAEGQRVAHHFNDASTHKSHGRRIGRDEAAATGVVVEQLEDSQPLQEAVLTAYHLMTIMFEGTPVVKLLQSDMDRIWMKQIQGA